MSEYVSYPEYFAYLILEIGIPIFYLFLSFIWAWEHCYENNVERRLGGVPALYPYTLPND